MALALTTAAVMVIAALDEQIAIGCRSPDAAATSDDVQPHDADADADAVVAYCCAVECAGIVHSAE